MKSDQGWLRPDERAVADWPAGVPTAGGRGARRGGRLHLTTQRLVWVPLEITTVVTVEGALLPTSAGGGAGCEAELSSVTGVSADPDHRATILIADGSAVPIRYLIQARRSTPLWSRKNQVACDEAVARINVAIEG